MGGPHSQSGRRGEKKILDPNRASNFNPSVVQPVASRCTDCAILAPPFKWVDRGKSRKISVRIAGVPTEFRTENLPNISLKGYRYASLVSCIPLIFLFLLLLLVLLYFYSFRVLSEYMSFAYFLHINLFFYCYFPLFCFPVSPVYLFIYILVKISGPYREHS
jgi:hypothetical protein